jgi:putative membrane protein
MAKQILQLIIRWFANSIGLWLATIIGLISVSRSTISFILAGLILALLNAILKPILIIFTLPLITLTLGFFLIIINAIILYFLSLIYSGLTLDNFILTILAGMVIGLVNYILTITFERLFDNE